MPRALFGLRSGRGTRAGGTRGATAVGPPRTPNVPAWSRGVGGAILTPGDSLVSAPGRAQLRIVADWQLAVTGAVSLVEAQLVARRLPQPPTLELRTRRR